MNDGELSFKIEKKSPDGKTEYVTPRGREVEVADNKCPRCKTVSLIVILGHEGLLYAYCPRCQKYYIGD